MITASLLLAAYATAWALIGLIQCRTPETRTAGVSGLSGPGRPIMMTARDNFRCEATGQMPPALSATREWHTDLSPVEREPRSEVATGGMASRSEHMSRVGYAHNVPRPRDRVNERSSRIGVGRRADVGTHRASRVPVRRAQSAHRRGGAHRQHPTRRGPFRDPRGPWLCAGEQPTHPAPAHE